VTRDGAGAAPSRFPSLDGIRAIAILIVLVEHVSGTTGFPRTLARHIDYQPPGGLGVRLFFALSGFLITTLLGREYAASGTISLRRFYWRRTLRIFPPYYLYVAVIAACAAAGWVVLLPGDLLAALTYTTNIHTPFDSWYFGHTWSLSIEEQFYLVWPALLLIGVARAPAVLTAIVLLVPALRLCGAFGVIGADWANPYHFRSVADWLAGGCLLALLREPLGQQSWYRALRSQPLLPIALAAVIWAGWTGLYHWRLREGTASIALLATLLFIDWAIAMPMHPIARALNTRMARHIGLISYSLYVWQQPFLDHKHHGAITHFPVNLALAFACAEASWWFVERPVLRWRERAGGRGQAGEDGRAMMAG
jgi:peptidoglycan/LPS O-acetylase OafA/YrhL